MTLPVEQKDIGSYRKVGCGFTPTTQKQCTLERREKECRMRKSVSGSHHIPPIKQKNLLFHKTRTTIDPSPMPNSVARLCLTLRPRIKRQRSHQQRKLNVSVDCCSTFASLMPLLGLGRGVLGGFLTCLTLLYKQQKVNKMSTLVVI